jgi:hypothetical protein
MGKTRDITPSSHHILPTSRNGSSEQNNLITLRKNYHVALHNVFANQTIDEQIRTLIDLSRTALNDRVTKELLSLLNSYSQEERYEEEAMKN